MIIIISYINKAYKLCKWKPFSLHAIFSMFIATSVFLKSITAISNCFLSSSVLSFDHMESKYARWCFCMNLKLCFRVAPTCRVFNLTSSLSILVIKGRLLVTKRWGPCLALINAIRVVSLQYLVRKPFLIEAIPKSPCSCWILFNTESWNIFGLRLRGLLSGTSGEAISTVIYLKQ